MMAKRSLGQNFLQNPGIVRKIAEFADLVPGDRVLEIGPGRGILTREIVGTVSSMIAIEKDDQLFDELREMFHDEDRLTLVHGDILEYDLSRLIVPGTKIVANLPYNIASQLIIRLTDYADRLSSIVVMVQREVAERICSRTGEKEYSALSVLVSAAFDTMAGFTVGPNNFIPRPKVDSQVIKLLPADDPVPGGQRAMFKRVVFQAFSQRRKMLRNSLLGLAGMERGLLDDLAREAQIDLIKRPQDLSPHDYRRLSISYQRFQDRR